MSSPLTLAIDTCFFSTKVTCLSDLAIVSQESVDGYGSAEVLSSLVAKTLSHIDANLDDLNSVCVVIGPGSFTGLRVGVSTAQAYSIALDIPVHGISSMLALALSTKHVGESIELGLQASPSDFFLSSFVYGEDSTPIAAGGVAIASGEPPEVYFGNGLNAEPKNLDWSSILGYVTSGQDKGEYFTQHYVRSQNGLDLSILYGKGSSAKTLSERGIHLK